MKYNRSQPPLYPGDPRAKNMTAAIYVRKSTESEGKSRSRDEQMELCTRDAQKLGFAKFETYVEEEGQKGDWWWEDRLSARPGPHRPELTRLVDDIASGHIQAVLVYKPDRLARDAGIADALHKLFRKYKTRYICNGFDTAIDTAQGLYQASVQSAAARQWRDNISEEVKRDHDYKFNLGMFTRNPACFGFRSAGLKTQLAVPQVEELELVRRIYRLFLGIGTTALGPYQIGNLLSKEGISVITGCKGHKSKKLERVQGTSIRQILKNSMYVGLWNHNGERIFCDRLLVDAEDGSGEKTTVIPEEWYHQAQAKLAGVAPSGRKAATSKRILAGLVVCGACGRVCHPLTKNLKDGSKLHRWICPYRYGATKCCLGSSYLTVVTDELDSWVIDHLVPFLAQELNCMKDEGEGLELATRKKSLEHKIAEARIKETITLKEMLGVIDIDQFQSLAQILLAERQELERQLINVNGQLAHQHFAHFNPNDLLKQDPVLIKEALKRFIQWIALTDKGITILTSFGTYYGARFKEKDSTIYSTSKNRRSILPPDCLSTAECLSWISDPVSFIVGRREAGGKVAATKLDHDLLPGAIKENRHAA